MAKVTFTVDDETVAKLRQAAEDLKKPQSMIVREAVSEYHARHAKLSPEERLRQAAVWERIALRKPDRTQTENDREIAEIRRARRHGGRRTRVD